MPKAFIAVALSATAFYIGTGLHPHWWMTWLAAVPVLVLAYHASWRAAFVAAFTAYFVGILNLWTYFTVLEIPIPVRILAAVVSSLIFGAGVLLSRTFFLRGRRLFAMLALPVVWTAFEFAMSFGRNGTALNLAYSQMDCLPLLQVASITGIWGISFFLFFFSSASAQLIDSRRFSRELLVPLAVVIVIFGVGFSRLHTAPTGRSVTIGLAATDQRPLLGDENKAAAITDAYVRAVEQLVQVNAAIIVIPEKIMTVADYRLSRLFATMRDTATQHSVLVVAGLDQTGALLKHNLAFAVSPSHEDVYEKHHIVVGWEDGYEVGQSTLMLPAPNQSFGVAICKDMDFPRLSRTYGQLGAELMLVPAWDFEIDDWLHSRMAIMRSVESGFAMARSAKQGFMTINDNRGRVLAQARSDATGSAHLLGSVNLSPAKTIYVRFGDWFAWLNLVGLVSLLSLAIASRTHIADKSA